MRLLIAICVVLILGRLIFPKGFKRILSILEIILGIVEQLFRILFHLIERIVRLIKQRPAKPEVKSKPLDPRLVTDDQKKVACIRHG